MKKVLLTTVVRVVLFPLSIFASISLVQADADNGRSVPNQTMMNNERLKSMIERVDPEFVGNPGYWQFKVEQLGVTVVTDTNADRMRILIPITKVTELTSEDLYRVLQANYDSTLDARYAVANGVLWGVYIHPLSSLSDEQFLSGLGQTVNIVMSYGKTYSSGMFNFRGGDSEGIIQKKLLEQLLEKGQVI